MRHSAVSRYHWLSGRMSAEFNVGLMGTYVEFWHGSVDGLLGHFVSSPLESFRSWCVEVNSEFPGDIETSILPLLDAVMGEGPLALNATTKVEALLCDQLIDTYYGMFCDWGPGRDLLERANDHMLYARRFESVMLALEKQPAHHVEKLLWFYLLNGRPVVRDPAVLPYESSDNAFWLSYWSAAEVALMSRMFAPPLAAWLLAADAGALRDTEIALTAATARGTGLIISVG